MKTVTVHIIEEELYPVYYTTNPDVPYATKIEISKKLLKQFNKAMEEFDQVQQKIRELVEKKD